MEMAIASEQTAYSSLLRRLYAEPAEPEPMLARPIRGGLLACLACIPPVRATIGHQPPYSRVSLMGMRLHGDSDCKRANRVQLAAQAAVR